MCPFFVMSCFFGDFFFPSTTAVYVSMSSRVAGYGSTGYGYRSCSWSAKEGKQWNISLSPFAPENSASQDGFGGPVPRQPAHLHAPFIYLNRHTPSGQSRVSRVTQLRTDGVHSGESVGTGPAVLKVVPVTGAASAGLTVNQLVCASLSHAHYWYVVVIACCEMQKVCIIAVPFCMESTLYVFLPDGVFLPCDHGLDFDVSLPENSINRFITAPRVRACVGLLRDSVAWREMTHNH